MKHSNLNGSEVDTIILGQVLGLLNISGCLLILLAVLISQLTPNIKFNYKQ